MLPLDFLFSRQVADQMCRWPNLHQEAHRPAKSPCRDILGDVSQSMRFFEDVPNFKWVSYKPTGIVPMFKAIRL